ncbi:MAG: hypothetical protein HOH94_09285, partial [Verrucomicrobia bacterium]|nr:hypothetical protein [Verrucomicrobiota bacterium]
MKIYFVITLILSSWLTAQEEETPAAPEEISPKVEVKSKKVDHRIVIEAPAPIPPPKL